MSKPQNGYNTKVRPEEKRLRINEVIEETLDDIISQIEI